MFSVSDSHSQHINEKINEEAGRGYDFAAPHMLKVMNCGAFSTKALVTLDTHLDMDAWLIPMVSPMDV